MTLAQALVLASAGITLFLGVIHLVYTFARPKLRPRDPEVLARMESAPLVISRQTTVWRAWTGFNASHSLGLLLFGAMYSYLALVQPPLLFHSAFLRLTDLLFLAGYAVLARLYWFDTPFRAVLVAFICSAVGFLVA